MNAPTEGSVQDELRHDAETLRQSATDRVLHEADTHKDAAVRQVHSASHALETAAGELEDSPEWLRGAVRQGSTALQRFADQLEHQDARQMMQTVRQFARDRPASFLGICALAGFAAARVVKAGSSGGQGDRRGLGTQSEPIDRAGSWPQQQQPYGGAGAAAATPEMVGPAETRQSDRSGFDEEARRPDRQAPGVSVETFR